MEYVDEDDMKGAPRILTHKTNIFSRNGGRHMQHQNGVRGRDKRGRHIFETLKPREFTDLLIMVLDIFVEDLINQLINKVNIMHLKFYTFLKATWALDLSLSVFIYWFIQLSLSLSYCMELWIS